MGCLWRYNCSKYVEEEQLYDYIIKMCPELCIKRHNHGNPYYDLKEDPFEASLDIFKFYVDTLVKAINEAG